MKSKRLLHYLTLIMVTICVASVRCPNSKLVLKITSVLAAPRNTLANSRVTVCTPGMFVLC